MLKESITRKLTSRKFWIATVTILMGIVMVFFCPEQAKQLDGALMTLISTISYLFAETVVDVSRTEVKDNET